MHGQDLEDLHATTEDITGLAAGNYDVTITDANGCTLTATIAVGNVNSTLAQTHVTTDATCVGNNGAIDITVTGGVGALTYAWTGPGGFTSTTEDITALAAGDYNLTVTDANGCVLPVTITVAQTASAPILTISNPSTVCAPNTIDLTAAGVTAGSDIGLNLTYWTDAGATTALANPNALATGGTFYIKATSAAGCTIIKPVIVTINTGPAPIVVVTDPAQVCEPSTVDLTNPGITAGSDNGLNYTYWMDAANTVPLPDPNAVGQAVLIISPELQRAAVLLPHRFRWWLK